MAGHGHSHGGCDSSGTQLPPDQGIHYSLYTKIDKANVECLNEAVEGSGKEVFKPWEERLNYDKFVDSDVDEELLFNIPFTGSVKLKGIILIGGEEQSHPSKMRLFKNRPHLSFDNVSSEAHQEFELHPDPSGTIEYSTKIVKFSGVQHLSLHFPTNFGAENTRIYYIGLLGEYSELPRQELTLFCYESAPNPADHKIDSIHSVMHEIH
ncbi:PITH domain-containing protein 1 isoform X1 [Tachypleus tridentatus]|uniref:PITH domain-containing protein 1 isoform X1 n=1 Tax=Tachypleus tridentatus TaxID=6853 RepID=UPI003FD59482